MSRFREQTNLEKFVFFCNARSVRVTADASMQTDGAHKLRVRSQTPTPASFRVGTCFTA
nr:gcu13b [Klebsiella pneumoniae]UIX51135.1 gcu13b [Providencia rettgeri]